MGIRCIVALTLLLSSVLSSSAQAKRPPSLSTVSLAPTAVAPDATGADRFVAALPPLLIGTGLGAAVFTIAAVAGASAGGWSLHTFGVGSAIGGVALIAAPTIAVAAFTDGLAPWTSVAVPLGVVVGGGAGFAVGLVGGFFLAMATAPTDCICGPQASASTFGTPIVGGVVLGAAGAIGATALGAAFAAPVGVE
ncbi:MAG TPA: hypothetical protein VGF99_22335 [Myxococcota bacterium]